MSAFKIQEVGNYPEESIQHSEHGESLKSRIRGINILKTSLQIKQAESLHGWGLVATQNGWGLVATQNARKIGDSVPIHFIVTQNSLTKLSLK